MNAFVDLIPAALFYIAFKRYDFFVATYVLIAASFGMVAYFWLRERRLRRMPLVLAVFVTVFGALTLYLHDPAFLKLKVSLIYAVIAVALLGSQLIGGRTLIERAGESTLQLPEPLWRRLNLLWALYFVGCAGLNLYIAQNYSDDVWVSMKFYGFPLLTFVFLLAHTPFLAKYLKEPPTAAAADTEGEAPAFPDTTEKTSTR